jgi:small subunit ribosomal protein S11
MLKIKRLNTKYISIVAIAYVYTTFNNTLITITSIAGKTILFGSSGLLGLKGAKRSTTYAGLSIANTLGRKICESGVYFLQVRLKGFGNSRKFVLKGFIKANLKIISIKDYNSISHNGCRKKKQRRI